MVNVGECVTVADIVKEERTENETDEPVIVGEYEAEGVGRGENESLQDGLKVPDGKHVNVVSVGDAENEIESLPVDEKVGEDVGKRERLPEVDSLGESERVRYMEALSDRVEDSVEVNVREKKFDADFVMLCVFENV